MGLQVLEFSKEDEEDPKQWPTWKKMVNVGIIALMASLSPLASSMFTPGISQIAECLDTTEQKIIGATTGFVVMLGVGPLLLAPLSETFGRRKLYLICFSIFSLLQIPTALSPNYQTLILCRAFAGFFGSMYHISTLTLQYTLRYEYQFLTLPRLVGVGISNGGGTISDMFKPQERASIFGWYLLGPLLGPTLGPLFGGLIVQYLSWRWYFDNTNIPPHAN